MWQFTSEKRRGKLPLPARQRVARFAVALAEEDAVEALLHLLSRELAAPHAAVYRVQGGVLLPVARLGDPSTAWLALGLAEQPARRHASIARCPTSALVAAFVTPASAGERRLALVVQRELGAPGFDDSDLHLLHAIALETLPRVAATGRAILGGLPQRLAEVVAFLCAGCRDHDICADLTISRDTLRSHLRQLYRHFGVRSRGELVGIHAVRGTFVVPRGTNAGGDTARLSERQAAIARMLTVGFSEKEIATRLDLSLHTVHDHVKTIYRVLSVRRRAELIARLAEASEG